MKRNILFNFLLILLVLACYQSNSQIINTVVGNSNSGYNGDSLQALTTNLNLPEGGVALDAAGNLFFCDKNNHRVRKYNPTTGLVTNIAGNGIAGFSGDGGQAKNASLNGPMAVALDKNGNIYIADYGNYRIRKVNAISGIISTIAGTGSYNYNGDNILAINAALYEPTGIAIDTAGHIYFSHLGDMRVRRIDKNTGIITTAAGTGTAGYNGDNILANTAKLNFPYGLDFDKYNNLYIADKSNYRIRKVASTTSIITTVVGNGIYGNGGNGGSALAASLKDPWDVDLDSLDNIYIADRFDNTVRKVSSGIINALAGNGSSGFSGDGGLAVNAMLDACSGVVANNCGAVYIVDRTNSRIRKVGSFSFIATSGNVMCYAACTGSISSVASGGNAPYTYSWTNLGNQPSYTNVCAGNYFGVCTDASGCKEQLSISISQPTQFTITAFTQTNVTCNTNGFAIPSLNGGAGGPYTFTWTSNSSTTIVGSNLAPGINTVIVKDANGCIASKTVNILFTPTLAVNVLVNNAICGSFGSATAQASGAPVLSYSWSNSVSTNSFVNSLNPGNYSVNVTDGNGCIVVKAFTVALLTPTFASVPICFVTVDSLSQHNVITWDKTTFSNADSFFVYREIGTNIYKIIHSQPYAAFSQFVDTVKTLYFPNTGNPNVGTYRYKLKTTDSCGNYSNYSPYHNTLFLVNNNGTFSWTQLYSIEGNPNPVSSYVLERDDFSTGNWLPVGSVAGTQQFIIDPNYSNFISTASWRVKTLWNIVCVPTQKSFVTNSSSYSNKVSNNNIGINELRNDLTWNVSPNPTKGILNFEFNLPLNDLEIVVTNSLGQEIYHLKSNINSSEMNINLTGNSDGIYLIKILTNNQVYRKKVILAN